jgi:periplasmic copper chaperone A
MDLLKAAFAAALTFSTAGAAQAHVSLTPQSTAAGAYQVLRFGVGHGCDGQATTALRIEIPDGVASARPQPKPGWTLQIERGEAEHVRAITWRGALQADQFDEFLIQVHLPAAAGPLAFPAVQSCGTAEVRWTEPAADASGKSSRPAPAIMLTPPDTAIPGGHHH